MLRRRWRQGLHQVSTWLDKQSWGKIMALSLALSVLVTIADYTTSPQVSTSVYYIMPIALAAWYAGRRGALVLAALAALSWLIKDTLLRAPAYTEQWIPLWNTTARFAIFALIAHLVAEVRIHVRRERELASTDFLTRALNRRSFEEQFAVEVERHNRTGHPFSLAYVDLDNFKSVNDIHGHREGDRVLRAVCDVMRAASRRTDLVARLGGDEFAILLRDSGAREAERAIAKLLAELRARMAACDWPIGFSVGLISVEGGGADPADVIAAADKAMYEVKTAHKDDYVHYLRRGVQTERLECTQRRGAH